MTYVYLIYLNELPFSTVRMCKCNYVFGHIYAEMKNMAFSFQAASRVL